MSTPPAVVVDDLSYTYAHAAAPALANLSFTLAPGARCLLLGRNGAGKSTLLHVLAGRHMVAPGRARVLGREAFHDTSLAREVVFVGSVFPFTVDVSVAEILAHQATRGQGRDAMRGQGRDAARDPERQEHLRSLLGVELDWHMHRVSNGQRRRVQLLLALMNPAPLLLLDEVTTDLDVVARIDLLEFLRADAETRGTTIVYATHIFDGLEAWATHVLLLERGRLARLQTIAEIAALEGAAREQSAWLMSLAASWLREAKP